MIEPDPETELAELGGELKLATAELRAAETKVAALRARVRSVASRVVAEAERAIDHVENKGAVENKPDHRIVAANGKLPKRMHELLVLLVRNPNNDTNAFAKLMYGNAEEASRRSVFSYFSRLKTTGYVVSIGRGRFKPTQRGLTAAGGGS